MTMAELAEATALTSGFLSQLERDLTSVSLSSLARICGALDVRFGDLAYQTRMALSAGGLVTLAAILVVLLR